MADPLDPKSLFGLIAAHVPADLLGNILVVGSLAAAYHHRDQLHAGSVRTKDVDIVIQPAGAITECRTIAQRLLTDGWRRRDDCFARPTPDPIQGLRAIRLSPPASDTYFIELLAFPDRTQTELVRWTPIELRDGWYVLPSFRCLGLAARERHRSEEGLLYATPAMMALANLLAHPTVGTARMGEPIGGRAILRSAKDLGRVLALALLAGRDETESWTASWYEAMRATFPDDYVTLGQRAGDGLRAMIADGAALDDARIAVDMGLLSGRGITTVQLDALARQLLVDAIEPLADRCRAG